MTWTLADVAAHYRRLGRPVPAEVRQGLAQPPSVPVVETSPPGETPRRGEGHIETPAGFQACPPITLTLPYPPSASRLYATGEDGRRHLSAKGIAYKHQVAQVVLVWWSHHNRDWGFVWPLQGRLTLAVTLHPPDRRKRRDVDNTLKLLQDSLTAAQVWGDDSQIDELHVYRGEVRHVACVEVTITEKREQIP